jgi:hypothetical protein
MANDDMPESTTPALSSDTHADANGYHDPVRERFRLRAQCAKLRHWCRGLLDAEGGNGVLSPEIERELRETPPAMSMDDVFAALRVISQGEALPSGTAGLTGDVAALASERERLSRRYFTLLDAVFPDEVELTDEHFQELADQTVGPSISEMLDQLDREFGEKP